MTDAFQLGVSARLNGEPLLSNPFGPEQIDLDSPELRKYKRQWDNGWMTTDRHLRYADKSETSKSHGQ